MNSRKRVFNNENTPITPPSSKSYKFIDFSASKKPRLSAKKSRPFTAEDLVNYERWIAEERERNETEKRRREEEQAQAQAEEKAARMTELFEDVWTYATTRGFTSLHEFVLQGLLSTRHPVRSSQVSKMISHHGPEICNRMRQRQTSVMDNWALSTTRSIIESELDSLARHLRPNPGTQISDILAHFSLQGILQAAAKRAPSLIDQLKHATNAAREYNSKKDPDLIIATTLCMLAKARHEHATEYQTTIAMYFLACGTSRSAFDVLNHAGITLSYSQAVARLKQLGEEKRAHMFKLVRERACMLIWDNLNIAYRVGEQRHNNKDHFDNGTTATLVPLFGVPFGGLPLELLPKRDRRIPVLHFTSKDLLPSHEEAQRLENGQLWHIRDILFDAYPDLRERLKAHIPPIPCVQLIPLHKTEQFPLPAMHIDESSLEGTLSVLDHILRVQLKLTDNDIKKHGVFLCAGDQLTQMLLDKVSAARRDDTGLMDNVGCYTKGQDGLFHMKMAADRMVTNEYWGKPNSKSPWSLWKANSVLRRKPMVAGWKAKSLPPFRPSWELILTMTLPSHILDAFRIHCPASTLDEWVPTITSLAEVDIVTCKILSDLCSARRVAQLRRLPPKKRDVPLENIILFNRDALFLRQFKFAIKRGDVGAILDIIVHWMLMFRGTGKMPKYADALFHLVIDLKAMKPDLRNAWLMNWLANLSGKVDGFKEMDLLQEHQNFWAKIVYCARGSNRSWEWLSMVTVSIFALRDVIRRVQTEYKTPFNGSSHTSPSAKTDIKDYCAYLEDLSLQSYSPERENNQYAIPARDLMTCGAEYANKPSAFRNFTYTPVDAQNHGIPEGVSVNEPAEHDIADFDLGHNGSCSILDEDVLSGDDYPLACDEDEYPPGTDMGEYISMTREVIEELSRYE